MMNTTRPKAGDRVRVKATGELGKLITTEAYNVMIGGRLTPSRWTGTRWVRFDKRNPTKRPLVVGHCPSELEVIDIEAGS